MTQLVQDRARVNTATTGTGTLTLGAAVSDFYCTFAEAGVANGATVFYLIEEGLDFEIGTGVYTTAGTTLTRAAVALSKIAGVAGTTKLTLAGAAVVSIVASAALLNAKLENLLEDTTPQLGGTLDTNAKQVRWSKGADVASAGALSLGADGNYFDITGTTSITSIGTLAPGTVVLLHFDGALTLTHHATDLILPGAANITTAAGDEAIFVEYATGDWRCTSYVKATGKAVVVNTPTEISAVGQGKQTIWVPAAAMWARTTNGPAAASRELTTNGDTMIKGWAFDTTTEEGVQFYIAFPKSWDEGTITFQAFWTNASGLTTETVSWGLSAGAFTDSDPIDTTELGTEVRVSDTWLAQNDIHVSAESSAVTVGNTPAVDDMVIAQIVRSVANDNMTGDTELLGVKIFYTINAATDA